MELIGKTKINDVIFEAEKKVIEIPEDKKLIRKSVEYAIEKLKKLPAMLDRTEFRLVFMGEPGCGKTSTIVNLCRLLPEELWETGPKKKMKTSRATLLPVGSGGTTMVENTEIIQVPEEENSHFVVECCSKKELEQNLVHYVEKPYLARLAAYAKENGKENEKELAIMPMPIEKERYIEVMCKAGIKRCHEENNPILQAVCGDEKLWKTEKGKVIQPELDMVVTCFLEQKQKESGIYEIMEFQEPVIREIVDFLMNDVIVLNPLFENSEKSCDILIPCPEQEDMKKFIRDTMDKLNYGNFSGITIVKNVKLYLSIRDLDMELTSRDGKYRITQVVDTRGYRSLENSKKNQEADKEMDGVREDFQQYLSRSEEGNICIFTERYGGPRSGGDVKVTEEIMKYNMKASYRTGLNAVLVNWHTGEPATNPDNKNTEQEEEDFYEEEEADLKEKVLVKDRLQQIKGTLVAKSWGKGSNINFNTENIFAYNALSGYSVVGNIGIVGYCEEEAQESRQEFLEDIFAMIDREQERIQQEITENYELLSNFLRFGDISVGGIQKKIVDDFFLEAQKVIAQVAEELRMGEFYREYQRKINYFHARAYKPLALHRGEYYGWKKISLFDINDEMVVFYSNHIKTFQNRLQQKYDEIAKQCSGAKDAREIMTVLKNILDSMSWALDNYEDEIKEAFSGIIKNNHFFGPTSRVWDEAIERALIGGRGVNDDIRYILLKGIDKETNKDSLYGSFPVQCENVQENIRKRIFEIVNICFGY